MKLYILSGNFVVLLVFVFVSSNMAFPAEPISEPQEINRVKRTPIFHFLDDVVNGHHGYHHNNYNQGYYGQNNRRRYNNYNNYNNGWNRPYHHHHHHHDYHDHYHGHGHGHGHH